ncbi:MAG TPA: permease-like cell division protein FtsX [Candidatus Kapabacteria bacterium]|nr:permease-like cell division protein FtsX [Candidatus Kapabacteria bacterium]
MFILRECLRSIRRSPISMVLIALTIGVGVGLTAVFAYVAYSAHQSLSAVERSISIDVYFDQSLSDGEALQIFTEITQDGDVAESRFITKETALKEYEAGTGQDVRSVLGDNPLPAGGTMKLDDASSEKLAKKIAEIKAINGVTEVLADQELVRNLTEKSALLNKLTTWLGALIALVILVVVAVATRLTVEIRKQSLTVMRLLGGSRWKVSGPFILEGLIAGLIGGVIASIVLLALDELALNTLLPSLNNELPRNAHYMATLVLLIVSAVLGTIGSALSIAIGHRRV